MQRELRFQREADPEWARQVSERPGCEGLYSCLQCGACSGTCPLSIYMDFTPRRIVALVREGVARSAPRRLAIPLASLGVTGTLLVLQVLPGTPGWSDVLVWGTAWLVVGFGLWGATWFSARTNPARTAGEASGGS